MPFVQNVKAWLQQEEPAVPEEEESIRTPRSASAVVSWGTLKAEASWNSLQKEEAREYDMYDEEDTFDDDKFELVQNKKQKRVAKRGKGKGKW